MQIRQSGQVFHNENTFTEKGDRRSIFCHLPLMAITEFLSRLNCANTRKLIDIG